MSSYQVFFIVSKEMLDIMTIKPYVHKLNGIELDC